MSAGVAFIGVDRPFARGVMLPDLPVVLAVLAVDLLNLLALLGLRLALHRAELRHGYAAGHGNIFSEKYQLPGYRGPEFKCRPE